MSANGFLRDDELTTVQGSGANAIRLSLRFAAVLRRMQTDAAKDGVRITLVSSYHGAAGYRSRATQLDMRVHPSLYSITPGIVPGLPSEHGTGNCGDIDLGLAWVKKNGPRYGVTFPLAFDPNHARYDGTTIAAVTKTKLEEPEQKANPTMRIVTFAGIKPQPAPLGPYDPKRPGTTGEAYYLVADEAGWHKPLAATQGQIEQLSKFIARDPQYFPAGPLGTCVCESQAQFDWFMAAITPPTK